MLSSLIFWRIVSSLFKRCLVENDRRLSKEVKSNALLSEEKMAAEIEGLKKRIKELEIEKDFLEQTINAYDSLTGYSKTELDDAYRTIKAQEKIQDLGRQELLLLKEQIHSFSKSESNIEREIIQILDEDPSNEENILEKFKFIQSKSGDDFFVSLFKVLINLELSMDEARETWKDIIGNKVLFSKQIGRNISFRVAMLDYFINHNKQLKNPKIIEIYLYEATIKSALIDALTGVFNRRYYEEIIESELNRAQRHNLNLSMLLLDIDDFKNFNDNYGHYKGDLILNKTGQLLKKFFRKEDTVCRYGGEEFVVIMPETSGEGAIGVAERFKTELKLMKFEDDISITFSGGIASFPKDAQNKIDLFIKADKAMYQAKKSGKDKIIISHDDEE